jgi:hypothetical protein
MDITKSGRWLWRMVSSGILRRVALVRTDVSDERSASFIRVTRIGELRTTLAVTSNSSNEAWDLALFLAIYDPRYFTFSSAYSSLWILHSEFHSSFLSHFVFLRRVRRLLVTASVVPSSPILVTLMKEASGSSETSVLTRATWRNIPEDTILHHKINYIILEYISVNRITGFLEVYENPMYCTLYSHYSSNDILLNTVRHKLTELQQKIKEKK